MAELPDDIFEQMTALSEQGNAHEEAGEYEAALTCFRQAWALLPDPKYDWEAATWLLAAIGEVLFLTERYQEALRPLQEAIVCGGLGNPLIHLRLGEVQYELGNPERAKEELARAYMGGGDEIFEGDDRKYWTFIPEILRPPANETDG